MRILSCSFSERAIDQVARRSSAVAPDCSSNLDCTALSLADQVLRSHRHIWTLVQWAKTHCPNMHKTIVR